MTGGATRVLGPRLALAAAAALFVAAVAPPAHATPSAKLTYVRRVGTETCPDEEGFRKAVASRLGYDPFFPSAPKTVVAEIGRKKEGGLTARVQIVGDDGVVRGERELEQRGEDCAEIVNAMALAISLALDDLDEQAPAPTPSTTGTDAEPPPPPPPPPPPVAVAPPPPAPAPRPRPVAWMVRARLGGHLDFGLAPAPAPGIDLGVDVRHGDLSAGLTGGFDVPVGADRDGGGRVVASMFAVGLEGCGHRSVFALCALARLDHFDGAGRDIRLPHEDAAWQALLGARLGLEIPLLRILFLAPNAELLVPLPRQSIEIDGHADFTQATVAGSVGLAVGARLF